MKTHRQKKIESLKGAINPTEPACYFQILGSEQWYLRGQPISATDIPPGAAKMVVQDRDDLESFESYIYEN